MDNIQQDIMRCSLCGNLPKLEDVNMQRGKTKFIIIGESPAKDGWIQSKKAFYNDSGKLQASGRVLEKLLNDIGLTVEDIYFTECCKCIIEDRAKLEKCSNNCKPILYKQLEAIPCNVIITMGLHPTQALLNKKIKKFADYVGKEFDLEVNCRKYKLIPIYHPSPLNPKGYKGNVEIFKHIQQICLSK